MNTYENNLALSAAPCSVEVKKLRWHNVDAYCAWCYADTEFGQYRVTWSFNEAGQKLHYPDGTTKQFNEKCYGDRDSSKAEAQADFERRILSQIVTKPVDAAAVRRQAFEEAKAIAFYTSENGQYMGNGDCSGHSIYQQGATEVYDALCDLISDISPAEPVDQWQDMKALSELSKLTYAIQHNPNCPDKYLVRLPGKGPIDLKPYGNAAFRVPNQTNDILGFGKTLHAAYIAATAAPTSKGGA